MLLYSSFSLNFIFLYSRPGIPSVRNKTICVNLMKTRKLLCIEWTSQIHTHIIYSKSFSKFV